MPDAVVHLVLQSPNTEKDKAHGKTGKKKKKKSRISSTLIKDEQNHLPILECPSIINYGCINPFGDLDNSESPLDPRLIESLWVFGLSTLFTDN